METDNENLVKKICRTCLCIDFDENFENLFPKEEAKTAAENIFVRDMISECTNFLVVESDEYPKQVCKKCVEEIKVAFTFKRKCEKSHQVLKGIIEKHGKDLQDNSPDLESTFITELHLKSEENGTQISEVLLVYPCEKCSEKFLTFEVLKKHIKDYHEEIKCRVCSKTFTGNKDSGTKFSATCGEYLLSENGVCKACNELYTQTQELNCLKDYEEEEQDEGEEEEENKDGSGIPWQYMCGVCHETFTSDEELKTHPCYQEENSHTSVKSEKSGVASNGEDRQNPLEEVEQFNLASTLINSDTESFYGDDGGDAGECSSGEGSNLLLPLQDKADSSDDPNKNRKRTTGKKYKTVRKRGRLHQCDVCDKVFSRSTHLRRHILTHSDEKPFACKICNKGFTRLDHLNMHMHHHSDTKPHVCEICQRGFVRAEHLRKHKDARHGNKVKTPKTEFCEVCKKGFTTAKYLLIHMRSHTDRIWSCKVCPEKFKTKPELTAHSKTHAANEKPYLCSECGLRFVRNDYLVIHMRRHKGEKPYKCKFCGKGFPRATDLTVHERYHTGEKTHLCTICGKGFQRAYNLLVHMRVHTGERPYECPHCTKRFAQGNDLKAHIRRHTGERFKCDICGDGFIQGYHLTQHKRNVHGIDMKSHIRRVEKFVTPVEQQKQMEAMQSQQTQGTGTERRSKRSELKNLDKNQSILTAVDVIKIEKDQIDMAEAISLSSEQTEMLERGQQITVVDGSKVTMISYFNSGEEKVKFDSTSD